MPRRTMKALRQALGGSHMLAFVPVLTLGAYWAGGERLLIVTAVILPLVLAAMGAFEERPLRKVERDPNTGLILRDGLIDWTDYAATRNTAGRQVAVMAITIDDLDDVGERFGHSMQEAVLTEAVHRLQGFLRSNDTLARLAPGFAVGLTNIPANEPDTLVHVAHRLQALFDEPFSDGPTRTYCTISLGIAAEDHVKTVSGANLVAASQRASELAQVSEAGAIRFYSEGLSSGASLERDVARELSSALETGEIFAWFQPQTRVADRQIVGFEALARWDHPDRGLLSPASFLPDVEKAGLSQRLAEVVLKQSLMALATWDAAGYTVPGVSVNFSMEELRNPRLPDYIRWELDRHGIAPERLVIEVLESVVANSNEDMVTRTLGALSRIGCRIDLDDFGTGFTSFMNIRRFDVDRIKIDRSLVNRADCDDAQHRMLAALLAFSDKMGLDVLAEGVETEGEVSSLKALGCKSMQGYIVARPLPLGETLLWLDEHDATLTAAPAIPDQRAV